MTRDDAVLLLHECQEMSLRVQAQAVRLGAADPEVNALRAEIQQRQAILLELLELLSSADDLAERFVIMLEGRGARLAFRPGTTDWHLDLDGVPDMTKKEAEAIANAALEIRDEIRRVLLWRRGDDQTVH